MRRPALLLPLAGLALVVLLAWLPLPDFWIAQLSSIGQYSLVVLGLVLLTGIGGLTSFGQAAFVGLGAYTTAWLTTTHGFSPWVTLFIGLAITGAVSFFLGFIIVTVGCHVGLRTRGGTEGVGRATTNAVVAASVGVIAMDFFSTQLLLSLLF